MNILFIAPIFCGYEKSIILELQKRFEKVVFCCEIPFNSPTRYFAIKRLFPKYAQRSLQKYNKKLISILDRDKIDKVFVIRGFGLLPDFLQNIKDRGLELINYQWDSLINNPNGLLISEYANKNFSFDKKDCLEYSNFVHVPLFYTWDTVAKKTKNEIYDVMFIGSYHSDRHLIAKKMRDFCDENGLKMLIYIYHPFGSFIRKKISGERISLKDIKFTLLSRQKYYEYLCSSKIVLDVQSSTQTGATIRTIETLSLGKKLISTNIMLEKEKFYSRSNILIWNGKEKIDFKKILATDFDHSFDDKILSVRLWVKEVLE